MLIYLSLEVYNTKQGVIGVFQLHQLLYDYNN
jgi:hypothetical protein